MCFRMPEFSIADNDGAGFAAASNLKNSDPILSLETFERPDPSFAQAANPSASIPLFKPPNQA